MDDLIERLRMRYMDTKGMLPDRLCHEAADRITALEAENARLRGHCLKLSRSFMRISGGGSELTTQVGDDYFADPYACEARVRDKLSAARKHALAILKNKDKSNG